MTRPFACPLTAYLPKIAVLAVPDAHHSLNDGAIIADVLAGRRERFTEIVQRYQRPLIRVATSRLGRKDWAEEAVQETFLCAFKSLHTYDSKYSFRTWLWTILLNQCRRHVQRRSRRPKVHVWTDAAEDQATHSETHSSLASSDHSPPRQLLAKERSEHMESLLAELPEAQADALRLRFFGELKFHEIADAMGCSLSTAKNRVRWGLEKMSQLLQPSHAQLEDAVSKSTSTQAHGGDVQGEAK